jgi:alkanesulfonate monooxygenase SsuD/methylene tetrahydromethanopterin reductase-like flavin-dependent oxidoreductase (luciferase family)
MKFGVFDHMDDAGVSLAQLYADRLTLVEAYDRAGIYGYHLAEHHSTPLGCAASPGLFLAAMAQRTKALRFGPLVYLLPFYHPLRLIEEICMLDQMSGGRFQLGVGRGVSPFETKAYGLDFAMTGDIYHEAYELILKGLASDVLTFEGKHFQFRDVPMILRPVQRPHPPLWYGTTIPENADWPAANDVNIVTIALRPTGRVITDRYRAVRARLGKNSGVAPLMGMARHIVVADTDAAALDIARRLSALAQQFSLAVPASRRRAADRGALSRDVRRTHGAGQRGCRFARYSARLHQRRDRGDGRELPAVVVRIWRHDAEGITHLARAVFARGDANLRRLRPSIP